MHTHHVVCGGFAYLAKVHQSISIPVHTRRTRYNEPIQAQLVSAAINCLTIISYKILRLASIVREVVCENDL